MILTNIPQTIIYCFIEKNICKGPTTFQALFWTWDIAMNKTDLFLALLVFIF